MKILFYILGALITFLGFIDGPNIALVPGFILLIIAYNFSSIAEGAKGVSSKKASERLLKFNELKEKVVLTQDEFDLKVSKLKDKL